jgi:WD40 repeat protein
MAELSDYEQVRLENIARNEEFLRSIGMNDVKGSIQAQRASDKPKASRRGVGLKRKSEAAQPVRRSGRVTIERLKAEDLTSLSKEERASKEEALAALIEAKASNSYDASIAVDSSGANDRWNRLDNDDISALEAANDPDRRDPRDDDDDDDDDDNDGDKKRPISSFAKPMLDVLREIGSPSAASSPVKSTASSNFGWNPSAIASYRSRMAKLKVNESDVAKVAEHRCCSIWVHPSESKLIVAAGDKSGNIGLWDVDNDNNIGVDGVIKYRYHVGNIARIFSFGGSPSVMHSVSYDGTIRSLDLRKDAFTCSFTAPESIEDMYYQDASELPSGSGKVLVGRSDGYVNLIDFRRNNKSYAWTLDVEAKVQSVQVWPTDDNLFLTSCSGSEGEISLWDMRKCGNKGSKVKSLATVTGHTKSINAAYASPDGKYVISASQDNTLRLWKGWNDGKSTAANITAQRINHDNHTGRWLSTFRPVWDIKHPHAFVIGSMSKPRCVEVFTVDGKTEELGAAVTLRSDPLASVCSRNAVHPTLDIIAASNSSGRVHVLR